MLMAAAADNLFNLNDSPPPIQLEQQKVVKTDDGLPDDSELLGTIQKDTESDER